MIAFFSNWFLLAAILLLASFEHKNKIKLKFFIVEKYLSMSWFDFKLDSYLISLSYKHDKESKLRNDEWWSTIMESLLSNQWQAI